MQAVIDTYMEEQPVSLSKIQEKFVKSITIYTDDEEQIKNNKDRNKFQQFMDVNENDFLNTIGSVQCS